MFFSGLQGGQAAPGTHLAVVLKVTIIALVALGLAASALCV